MRLIAIDPGAKTGWALFQDSTLIRCGTVPSSRLHELPDADACVVEFPRARRRHPRPDDLLKLAAIAAECCARYSPPVPIAAWVGTVQTQPRPTKVFPETWKGQLPKDVCWKRVRACLWAQELAVVDAPLGMGRFDHNARDAIGIGLWYLGRFGK